SRGGQQLLLGPWLHGRFNKGSKVGELTYPDSASFDVAAHMIRWFDHHLKGVDNGADRDPAVRYYVMGAVGEDAAPGNEWRVATDWPVPSKPVSWYLQPSGGLATNAPAHSEDAAHLQADPHKPAEIPGRAFPGARDARAFEQQENVLTFTSDVLTEPVEWTGLVAAELFVASSSPDARSEEHTSELQSRENLVC